MIDDLNEVLLSLEGVFDGMEPIDELSHALQTAELALAAGYERDFVTAALFHDVARSVLVSLQYPTLPHEQAGANWLKPRFGVRVAWLAGAHVAAKLFLLANHPKYVNRLSDESKLSATLQATDQSSDKPWSTLSEHRWWADAVQLRRFDDGSKKTDAEVDDPKRYLALVRPLLIH